MLEKFVYFYRFFDISKEKLSKRRIVKSFVENNLKRQM